MMTVHKLTAGDGYTYLTRQVASSDELRPRGQSLADYYAARGNPPGAWMGGGARQLGLAGGPVSEAQMRALFGAGLHPNAEEMKAGGATKAQVRLGSPFPSYADLAPYPERVAARIADFASTNDRPPSEAERNQIAAKEARRGRRAVAGYDLVFTPVKSVSLLWGLSDPKIRQEVEDAHHAAVASALAWVEQHAAFTRTGHGGVAQVDTTGLICAAFDHRESRTGDPDLHTHVAVANKVCGLDGKWRSLDARGLFALGVAASERYNTRLEDELSRRLGVEFEDRPGDRPDKRPVREIVGIPLSLIRHFSRRRVAIEARLGELREDYRQRHGREPDHSTQLQLAQQATLETREGKPSGRTLAEQVADWRAQARSVLGESGLRDALAAAVDRAPSLSPPEDEQLESLAREVVRRVAEQRSTWTMWNVYAEAERLMRPFRFANSRDRDMATQAVVGMACGPGLSIRISEPELITEAPELTRASDGQSVFVAHGAERFTTSEVLLAEDALVTAGRSTEAPHCDDVVVQAALAVQQSRTGLVLDCGQRTLVERFAGSPARVVVGIGPAGAGKTTAMQAFAQVWRTSGGRVVPLATSAKAAQVLGSQLETRAENLHKFLFENEPGHESGDSWFRLGAGDVVLVDEAGMAGTLQLSRLLDLATDAGATIRLLGDPAQLASVDAGGALRLLEHEVGATHLTELHRFADPYEGRATLMLRDGDPSALVFYRHRDRIRSGSVDTMLETAYAAWATDVRAGKHSVLIAARNDDVTALNARARHDRVIGGDVEADGVVLRDGNLAGAGDWIVTRENVRTLRYRRSHWVHNGDTWTVLRRHRDGSMTVRNLENRGKVRLPASYVEDSVELAYASTAHRVQGMTTDTAHALVTAEMTREALYVASTRGRQGATWYVATETGVDVGCDHEPPTPLTTTEVLEAALRRTSVEQSATETLREVQDEATTLPTLVKRYDHARDVAARDALAAAAATLPTSVRSRVLGESGTAHLARVLADAAAQGADTQRVLLTAYDLEPLGEVRSPASVLASRIEDHPRVLGIPRRVAEGPLPWLPSPGVGHDGWHPYLQQRAKLISDRAAELGSLEAAYREQYDVGPGHGLGDAPEPGTRQATAYAAAAMDEASQFTNRRSGAAEVRYQAGRRGSPRRLRL